MRQAVLGSLTIGQAPRPDVTPIIDSHVPAAVRRVHRGVLDGLPRSEIDRRYRPAAGEAVLVTRLLDGSVVELSRELMQHGVQQALAALGERLVRLARFVGRDNHIGRHPDSCTSDRQQ